MTWCNEQSHFQQSNCFQSSSIHWLQETSQEGENSKWKKAERVINYQHPVAYYTRWPSGMERTENSSISSSCIVWNCQEVKCEWSSDSANLYPWRHGDMETRPATAPGEHILQAHHRSAWLPNIFTVIILIMDKKMKVLLVYCCSAESVRAALQRWQLWGVGCMLHCERSLQRTRCHHIVALKNSACFVFFYIAHKVTERSQNASVVSLSTTLIQYVKHWDSCWWIFNQLLTFKCTVSPTCSR